MPAHASEWYEKHMYGNKPITEWHTQKFGPPDKFGYKDFIPMFTCENWDPEAWAELFRKSGAKFTRRRTEARQAAAEAQRKAEEALRARAAQDREALAARLVTEATAYEDARRIRRYARAVLRACGASGDPETRAATKQWYDTAMDCSDLLDPIVKRFPAASAGTKPAVIRVEDLDISGDRRLRLVRQGIVDTDGIYKEYRTISERLGYDRNRDEMRVVLRVCGYPVPRGWW